MNEIHHISPRLLVLSDLHFIVKNKSLIEEIYTSFLNTLTAFWKEHPEWIPNCLVCVGDIADRSQPEEYREATQLIKQLRNTVPGPVEVLIIPGNHDKSTSGTAEAKNDSKKGELFLENCNKLKELSHKKGKNEEETKKNQEKIKKLTDSIHSYLDQYFKNYTDFVAPFQNESQWIPVPEFKEGECQRVSGIYILEKLELAVLAVNTEWKHARNNGEEYKPMATIGKECIKEMEKQADAYKRKGYTVITLMHRSPYQLDWDDIYGVLDEKSPVNRIIAVSDLIICAHEHHKAKNEPDLLMNRTQLFQSGCMYDPYSPDGRYPYSATLMRINDLKRTIETAEIRFDMCNAQEYTWIPPHIHSINTYYMDPLRLPYKRVYIGQNELHKEITLSAPLDTENFRQTVLRLFYPLKPDNCTEADIPADIICQVEKLNKQTITKISGWLELLEEKVKDTTGSGTSGKHSMRMHVILYCIRETVRLEDKFTQEALQQFKELKKEIREREIGHKLIVNLIFCNILTESLDY